MENKEQLQNPQDNSIGELEKLIQQKLKEYNYLITEEHAKYLIVNEKNLVQKLSIKNAKESIYPSEIEGVVKKIYLTKKVEKNNRVFLTQRILLEDETDWAIVLFFDSLALEVANKIMTGDRIVLGPLKYIGEEFRALATTKIKVIKKAPVATLKEGVIGNFEGEVLKVVDKKYKTKNGEEKILSKILLAIGQKKVVLNYWESPGLEKKIFQNSKIRIENAIVRDGQIHLNAKSRLLYIYLNKPIIKLEGYKFDLQKVILKTNKEEIVFSDLKKLALYLGLKNLSSDIDLKKVLEIKLSNMIGKSLPPNYIDYL